MGDLPMNKKRLIALDGFRIYIVTMVLLFHAVIHKFWHLTGGGGIFFRNIITGAVYMDAFFILSGFVLYYLYGDRLQNPSFQQVKDFYLKRFLKLYPSYLVFTVVVMVYDRSFDWKVLPAEILCLQGFFRPIFSKFGNGGTWFISCIAFSYLLFPVLCRMVNAKTVGIMLFSFVLIVYITAFSAWYKVDEMSVYINPLYRMWEFIIGMCLSAIFLKREQKALQNGSAVIPALCAIGTCIVLFVIIAVLYKNNFVNHRDFARHYIYYACVTVPLFSAIIFALAALGDCHVKKSFLLQTISFLSALTFPFFLWQGLAERLVRDYACIHGLVGFIAVNLLLAGISHLIFSRLAIAIGKKMKVNASS